MLADYAWLDLLEAKAVFDRVANQVDPNLFQQGRNSLANLAELPLQIWVGRKECRSSTPLPHLKTTHGRTFANYLISNSEGSAS